MSPLTALDEQQWQAVVSILSTLPPETRVFAFGSRASGKGVKPFSDLDLLLQPPSPLSLVERSRLVDAFDESDLPFRVDVLEHNELSDAFLQHISQDLVLIYPPPLFNLAKDLEILRRRFNSVKPVICRLLEQTLGLRHTMLIG